jgi:hypothetical protein
MSTEEFIEEIRERHKDDIEQVIKLLEVLKALQEEKKEVYEFSVTCNL